MMTSPRLIVIATCLAISPTVFSQVDEIKRASHENSSRGSSQSSDYSSNYVGSSTSSSSGRVSVFFNLLESIGDLQRSKLKSRKDGAPWLTSLEVMFQSAIQPSTYYVVNPRIRGNWGLFSTDFRFNYVIEEDIEGSKHIRTDDWQIIQLNLLTSKYVTLRLGTGIMHEDFSEGNTFNESSFMLFVHSPSQRQMGGMEYRIAKDWETKATPRWEWNIQYQHQIFNTGSLHGFLSIGGVYQRYYSSINVWGIQGGLVLKVY